MLLTKIILTVLYIVGGFLSYELFLPAIGFNLDFITYAGILGVIGIVLITFWFSKEVDDFFDYGKYPIIAFVIFLLLIIIIAVYSTSLFHADKMYNQLGSVEDHSFTKEIVPIDTYQIPTVDAQLAKKQGEKKLGEIPALGSQVELGEFTIQQVQGKLVFVAPLEHTGFFKWKSNKTTPGYIVVSATNPSDVQLVTDLNGEALALKYLKSSYFGSDILRYVRSQGYRTDLMTSFTFELDDTGRPYWTITKYENTIGFGSAEAIGTIIVDVQTGEIQDYSIEDTPEWVDIIQPSDFIEKQIKRWGSLPHGPFNFSQKDEFKKTEGILTVYNDGKCYYYTGLTSVGNDEATIGFVMIDTRTKEAHRFLMSGATEDAAMSSAEGMVQDLGYKATEPVPLNMNGVPTYFLTLKDDAGLIKKYAMVNIQNYAIVGIGDTINQAKSSYMSKLATNGNTAGFEGEAYSYEAEGVITRISSAVEAGETFYYFVLDNDFSKVYVASNQLSSLLPVTEVGDTVKVSYVSNANTEITVNRFENVKFNITKTEEKLEQETETQPIESDDNQIYKGDEEKAN